MVSKRLIEYREYKGWSQEELANKICVSKGTIAQLELKLSKYPSGKTLKGFRENTDCDILWLLTGEGAMIRSGELTAEEEEYTSKLIFIFREKGLEIKERIKGIIDDYLKMVKVKLN